mmetsp:Transcript_5737/g.14341  ORF Transcript_5737/g.14341 Transcript_5737/m.14341 type:complete len:158 (+) Transcript_5737:79-552(+)
MSNGTKQSLSIDLPVEMVDWLDSSAKAHSLSSQSKAVRCCVNCVAIGDVDMVGGDDETNSVFDTSPSKSRSLKVELAPQQMEWINSICNKNSGSLSQSQVVGSVINACMNAEEDVVFGVVRCKMKVSECEGSQEAIDLLSQRYGENGVVVKEEIKLL